MLDHRVIRNSRPTDLAAYFQSALARFDHKTISDHLLSAVASEALPPRVCSVWLHVCHDTASVIDALRQPHSVLVRKIAIKCFVKYFRTQDIGEAWTAAGDTAGILELLSRISVSEVKLFCRLVGSTATSTTAKDERQRKVTELLQCLAHDVFSEARLQNPDRRPLLKQYSRMLPACTSAMVENWMKLEKLPTIETNKLVQAHFESFRSECLENVDSDNEKTHSFSKYAALFRQLPPLPGGSLVLSASMEFSIDVLKDKTLDRKRWFDGKLLHDGIMVPLLRRLWTRRCTPAISKDVLTAVIACLQRYESAAGQLSFDSGKKLMYYVLRLRSRDATAYETALIALLKCMPHVDTGPHRVLAQIAVSIDAITYRLRLQFLRLVLRYHKDIQLDLEDDGRIKSAKFKWPVRLLLALPRRDALTLLRRLINLRPTGDFLNDSNLPSRPSILEFTEYSHPSLLLLLLSRTEATNHSQAEAMVKERRKEAETSRDQEDRAHNAKYAIVTAIASASLPLLHDTLLWARRYNRDALTIKELYSNSVETTEAIDLLRGFAKRPSNSNCTLGDICRDISAGNDICKLLLETACMALREPSFALNDWYPILYLFEKVVRARIEVVNQLQEALSLTDEQVHDGVWKNTLETCIHLEQVGLEEGHERLTYNRQGGTLARMYRELVLKNPSRATLRFIDELARRRDSLWRAYRPTIHPSAVSLSDPWPKGLPVQCLAPFAIPADSEFYQLPFVCSRAAAVVLIDPASALEELPSEEITREAIGTFVDDYKYSLGLWINQCPHGPPRRERTIQAWRHALEALTTPRMTRGEGLPFWRGVFSQAGVDLNWIDVEKLDLRMVELPTFDDASEATEWDPDLKAAHQEIKSRALPATCLDCMLSCRRNPSDTADSKFAIVEPRTVAVTRASIWTLSLNQVSGVRSEALIAAALLFLSARMAAGSRVLSRPFPDARDVRFPALFLDQDFLDRKDHSEHDAIAQLDLLKQNVPPTLLHQLVTAMFAAADKQPKNAWVLEQNAIKLLVVLMHSDRPQTALGLVTHIILERPDNSSWYRHVFNKGLVDSLSAAEAESFMQELSRHLQHMLQQGREQTNSSGWDGSTGPKPPIVKITTIKMLAGIMSDAEFVGQDLAVNLLAGLFANVHHLDGRVVIIESLTHIVEAARDDNLRARVFETLEKQIIPIAASVNERRPMSEADWQRAEVDMLLPEVYAVSHSETLPPILNSILDAMNRLRSSGKDDLRQRFCTKILLPTLKSASLNNQRWLKLFARSLGVGLQTNDFPEVPCYPAALARLLLNATALLPSSVLYNFATFIKTNLTPSHNLRKVTAQVLASPELRTSNAGSHWLSLFHITYDNAMSYGGLQMPVLLGREWTAGPDGITYANVQQHCYNQIKLMIVKGSATVHVRDSLLRLLEPTPRSDAKSWTIWTERFRPLVQQIIEYVDSQRTEEWQNSRNRTPDVLPDTFGMRLWLLSYPNSSSSSSFIERRDLFAMEIWNLIEQLSKSTRPYHERFQKVKVALLKVKETYYIPMALQLNSLKYKGVEPTLADWLRVELVETLLLAAHKPTDHDKPMLHKARDLLTQWKSGKVEDLRVKGMHVSKMVRQKRYGAEAWLSDETQK